MFLIFLLGSFWIFVTPFEQEMRACDMELLLEYLLYLYCYQVIENETLI